MKRKFKMGISQRIFLSFFGLIGLFTMFAVFCYQIMVNSTENSTYMSRVVDPSLKAMDDFQLMVVESKMLTTNWVFFRSKTDDKEALHKLHDDRYPQMKHTLDSLIDDWNDKAMADSMRMVIADCDRLVRQEKKITGMLVKFEDYDDPMQKLDAESTLEDEVLPLAGKITNELSRIIEYKKDQKALLEAAVSDYALFLRNLVIALLIVFIIVSLILGFYMSNIITKPIIVVKNAINALSLGKLNAIKIKSRDDEIGEMITSVNHLVTNFRETTDFANSIGQGNFGVDFQPLSEHDVLGKALIDMKVNLTKFTAEERDRSWLSYGMNEVGTILRQNHESVPTLAEKVLAYTVNYVGALQGAIYRVDYSEKDNPCLKLLKAHGLLESQMATSKIKFGEGIIGQVAIDKKPKLLTATDGLDVAYSGINQIKPKQILFVPIVFDDELLGIFEISSVEILTETHIDWITRIAGMTAATYDIILRKQTTEHLLKEARKLNTELLSKEDALRKANQQMQEKAIALEEQNEAIRTKNESLEIAREAIRAKADELEKANKYKSEFLANMSHELRTPLNSILILSNLLSENKDKTLTSKQVDYARVIQKSGSDLLSLINDILDLSKIESNHMEIDLDNIDLREWVGDIQMLFSQVAENKAINFEVDVEEGLPHAFQSDPMRLSQIIKNLLSNAFKFTDSQGAVHFKVYNPAGKNITIPAKLSGTDMICLEVTDTGIGIPKEKQQLIFEPFRQADGSTSRKFGGTGLGLSISRELSLLLGGEMTLTSEAGAGSSFKLFIPLKVAVAAPATVVETKVDKEAEAAAAAAIVRSNIPAVVRSVEDEAAQPATLNLAAYKILVVDDDMRNIYALTSILDEFNPTIIMANNGQEAIDKLKEHDDIDLVLMDIMMPVMDGYQAMRTIRRELQLTHLPIIAVTASAMAGEAEICKRAGASDYLPKPVSKKQLVNCISHWLNLDKAIAV